MKKVLCLFIVVFMIITVAACGVSSNMYNKVTDYIMENSGDLSSNKDVEFFIYDGRGLPSAGVYYGYYYTVSGEPEIPNDDNNGVAWDYTVDDSFSMDNEGYYWGKPNNGTDWYYTRKITDNWYYYELHCS